MKKLIVVLSYISFILFFVTLCISIFSKYKFFYLVSSLLLVFSIILLLILFFTSKNEFGKSTNKIYKNNYNNLKTILFKELKLSQSKKTINIEFVNGAYHLTSNEINYEIKHICSSVEMDNDLLYFLFYKVTNSIIFSHSLKSVLNLLFNGKLLIKNDFKNIEIIDLRIKRESIIWSKYIKLRFGDVTLSPNWRLN